MLGRVLGGRVGVRGMDCRQGGGTQELSILAKTVERLAESWPGGSSVGSEEGV